jgi:protocatechuate 3,4-dioxygenase alpha subunit
MDAMPTPSQTIGPFFAVGLPWLTTPSEGDVVVRGTVYDGDGEPVDDAMLETWQATPDGDVATGAFRRVFTDDAGGYSLRTTRPRRVDDAQAPHIDVSLFARGLLQRVVTRIYLSDDCDPERPDDLLLGRVEADRRHTLIARREGDEYRFDIHLQGEQETVFLAW